VGSEGGQGHKSVNNHGTTKLLSCFFIALTSDLLYNKGMFKKKKKNQPPAMPDASHSEEADGQSETSSVATPEREFFYNLDEIEAEVRPNKKPVVEVLADEEDENQEIIIEDDEPVSRATDTTESLDTTDSEDWVTEDEKLSIDVYQDRYNIYITSLMPGVETEDIAININNDMITIRGRRQEQSETHEDDFFFRECYWGNVSRSVILPVEIDAEKVEAALKNGILTITLPKVGAGRDITINVKDED